MIYLKKTHKGLFSKVIIVAVIIGNILFTLKILDVFEKTSVEPAALIVAWFAFTTGELSILGMIKKNKVNSGALSADIIDSIVEAVLLRLQPQEPTSDDDVQDNPEVS